MTNSHTTPHVALALRSTCLLSFVLTLDLDLVFFWCCFFILIGLGFFYWFFCCCCFNERMSVYIWCVCVCVCGNRYALLNMNMRTCVRVNTCVCMCVFVRIFMYKHVFGVCRLCMCECMYVCIYLYVHVKYILLSVHINWWSYPRPGRNTASKTFAYASTSLLWRLQFTKH